MGVRGGKGKGGAYMWAKTRSGKRVRFPRAAGMSARQLAAEHRPWFGGATTRMGDQERFRASRRRARRPKLSRRKLGAKRKVTLIQQIVRYIPVIRIRKRRRR